MLTFGYRINNYVKLFAKYGPLVNVSIFGVDGYSTNDPAIAEIFVKESEYFTKKITKDLAEVRKFAGDGLFTSNTDEENWELAHKLLMPAFSPRAIKVKLIWIMMMKGYILIAGLGLFG